MDKRKTIIGATRTVFRIGLTEALRDAEMAINTPEKLMLALNFVVSYLNRQVET